MRITTTCHHIGMYLGAALLVFGLSSPLAFGLATNDDFNDNSKNSTLWGSDLVTGHGALTETNQHVEFRVTAAPGEYDQDVWPWVTSAGPFNANWEAVVDTHNITAPTGTNQQAVAGISITDLQGSNEVIAVQYTGGTGAGTQVGFVGRLTSNTTATNIFAFTLLPSVTNGAVRVAFNGTSKVVTLYYDADTGNGYTWTQFATFGLAGSGGANGNLNWGLGDTNYVAVRIYGYASHTAVAAGEITLDNFSSTGLGVPPLPHDLAVTKLKVPKSAALSDKKPSVTSKAVVTIQNLGPFTETITAATITNLVAFELHSLAPSACPAPVPVLVMPKTLPIQLAPKKSLNLNYTITFDCANNAAKGVPDFSYTATVQREVIDEQADTHPENDVCPRAPSGSDKGCGNKLGGDVTTDVTVK